LRAHVEFLADDLLEGRATGSRGHALAAAYVAAQFKQLGLEPLGDAESDDSDATDEPSKTAKSHQATRNAARSYLQSVRLLQATPVLPGSSAKLVRDRDEIQFEYGGDYLPSADYSASNSTLTASLTFVGFGVTAPEQKYDDLDDIDLHGRIAVVLSGAPASFPHDQRAYYSWDGTKLPNLIRRGAVGVITIDTPEDAKRRPWEQRVKMSWQPQMRWVDSDDQPVDTHPEIKQRFRFSSEAAAKFFFDSGHTLDEVFAMAEASEPQALALTGTMTLTTTTGLRRTDSSNVVAMLDGKDPVLKREYIVISAHLDGLGRGASVNGDDIYNGAHDNAAGIAVLIEAARQIVASGAQRRSIIFLATTGEEKGLLGSDYFVNNGPIPKRSIVANINIDMPRSFGPTRDIAAIGAAHSNLGPMAQDIAAELGYLLTPDDAPEQVRFIRSDHFSFVRHGIPALHLSIGYLRRAPGPNVVALREAYQKERYHKPSDDLTAPMYYPGMADLAWINARLVIEAASRDDRPRWNRRDFFASKFPRSP